jgi:excinuclease ABC subunit A
MSVIKLRGVKTHNLKNIDLDLPRDKYIVITGLSGSGKSSLAFDTLYAEGQRRYVESLSAYARQFLSVMSKPDVEVIEGLSPAISIEQKATSHNPRSTVGTMTEIYDYLRLLFARAGQPRCPSHQLTLEAQPVSHMVDTVLSLPEGKKIMVLAPMVRERKGEYIKLMQDLQKQGFIRARIDGKVVELADVGELDSHKKHTIEVVVDRLTIKSDIKQRLAESLETALHLSNGLAIVDYLDKSSSKPLLFSSLWACPKCGYSIEELEPRLFSFNNPKGACPACDGLGTCEIFDAEKVVHRPDLSLRAGAIKGWDARTLYHYQILKALATHYHFSMETPFNRLPKKIQTVILYGSGDAKIEFSYINADGEINKRQHTFDGVIRRMEHRYQTTDSIILRDDLSQYLSTVPCTKCQGSRLCEAARYVFVGDKNIADITAMPIDEAYAFFTSLKLVGKREKIAAKILKEVNARLKFLIDVGLNYLTLSRRSETLSGGEAQRIRLASQIGSGLVGVMYVLDEPTIGLHQRDNQRLLNTLLHLKGLGNTVIVVEHDEEAILSADHVVDIGEGAGIHGGEIIAQGTPTEIMASPRSLTGQYLSKKRSIPIPKSRRRCYKEKIVLKGAKCNNLKNIDVEIPTRVMVCITGVSGSGKSSLINDTFYPIVAQTLNKATQLKPGTYGSISGLEFLDKVVDINQSPIGRTPRSNPATYTGLLTPIRELFAATPEARMRGYKPGRFSFNVEGGRCAACEGDGVIKVEMHFLADMYVTCDTCRGQRYNRETLEIKYKGKNIHDILSMTVEEAYEFFNAVPVIKRRLATLMKVGLAYLPLGQSATTLSGGEAQRIKLSKELSKRDTGRTLYILDEPTTGLHFYDIQQLLHVLIDLRDRGNTIVVIEHNLDVIKTADWVIDLGPEGGDKGGYIIVEGTPETVAKNKKSYTGQFLKKILNNNNHKAQ